MSLLPNPSNFVYESSDRESDLSASFNETMLSYQDAEVDEFSGFDSNEGSNEADWHFNVVVKFNVNPASVITFRDDSLSGRVIVAEIGTEDLHFLKGLPILSINEQNVARADLLLVEGILTTQARPVVLKFGAEPVDTGGSVTCEERLSLRSNDTVAFLGLTSTVTFEDDLKQEYDYVNELGVVPEELSVDTEAEASEISVEEKHCLQPISFDGTQGDQSGWSEKCKQRAEVITELLNTEKYYIKGLEDLNENFLKPYLKPLQKFTHVDVTSFQIMIENLICLHDKIYENFCIAGNICTVFQQEFKFLKMYNFYIKDYKETFLKLSEVSTKRAFKSIFKKDGGDVGCNPLNYFNSRGITLVQRPTRYGLLLKELQKNTPIGHPMYRDLANSLIEIQATLAGINEYQRRLENEHKFVEISRDIDHKSLKEHGIAHLVDPARRLIRLGKVAIKKTRSDFYMRRRSIRVSTCFELGAVLMCNDILVVMHGKKNVVLKVFMLEEIEAELMKDPIKTTSKFQKCDEVYELVLRKRCSDDIKRMHANRERGRVSLYKRGRSSTSSLIYLSTASVESSNDEYFSIYLSTLEEAEEWEKSILKYSNLVYAN